MRPTTPCFRAALPALALTLLAPWLAVPAAAEEPRPLPRDLPPYGQDKPLPVPEILQSTLDNGLTVWLVPRPGLPKVSATLVVRGGVAVDPPGQEGISEVFAAALKSGTAGRTARQIAEELQAVGGQISTAVDDDAVFVSVDGLSTGADRLLEVLADVALRAAFPPAEVELEKVNALEGLKAQEATPEFAVDKAFSAAVHPDHPYRYSAPEAAALAAATPELLRGEFARRFRPERSLLLVVGALDPAATATRVEADFGGWKSAAPAPDPVPPAPTAAKRQILLVDRPGSVQSEIRVGRPAVEATSPDFYPLLVANTVFGGAFGSRLVQNIREEKGYTYSPGAAVQTRAEGGRLRVRAAVRNEVTAASLLEIFYELDRMGATLPTADELTRAKRFQTGLYLLRNQIQGALVFTLASNWVKGLPPEALGEFVPRVEAVTAEQVREVGRSYFASRNQTVVVGGDVATIRAEVEQFGDARVVASGGAAAPAAAP
jgi:predicted Zn-dependent peptidase